MNNEKNNINIDEIKTSTITEVVQKYDDTIKVHKQLNKKFKNIMKIFKEIFQHFYDVPIYCYNENQILKNRLYF